MSTIAPEVFFVGISGVFTVSDNDLEYIFRSVAGSGRNFAMCPLTLDAAQAGIVHWEAFVYLELRYSFYIKSQYSRIVTLS